MTQIVDDSLEAGREAARRHAWRDAYDLLRSADENGALAADDLESLGDAAWWTGRLDEAIGLRERAYAAFVEAGEPRRAAMVTAPLAMDYGLRGALSVATGWISRGERLLAEEPEGVEHGRLSLMRGTTSLDLGELEQAGKAFHHARELGARFGDRSLETTALVFEGAIRVWTGDVEGGLAILDEATAAATSGELEPLATGIIYCVTIDSCQALGDCGRAAEWTEAANRWCDRLDVTGFPGACRVHRAQILRLSGDWPKAEEQAIQACEELHDYNRSVTASGFYEIGEIRRRQGNFAAAEEAYRKADELGRDPQPGLALLRLAQGKVDAAGAAIRRALAHEELDPLSRSRRLPAQVEIALAAGELRRAREAADELEAIADQYQVGGRRTPVFEGAVPARRRPDPAGRARLGRRREGAPRRPGDVGQGRRTVRERPGSHAARARLPRGRRRGRLPGRSSPSRGRRSSGSEPSWTFSRRASSSGSLRPGARSCSPTSSTRRSSSRSLGEEKWRKLLAWHDRTLRELIEAAGGEVIKQTG